MKLHNQLFSVFIDGDKITFLSTKINESLLFKIKNNFSNLDTANGNKNIIILVSFNLNLLKLINYFSYFNKIIILNNLEDEQKIESLDNEQTELNNIDKDILHTDKNNDEFIKITNSEHIILFRNPKNAINMFEYLRELSTTILHLYQDYDFNAILEDSKNITKITELLNNIEYKIKVLLNISLCKDNIPYIKYFNNNDLLELLKKNKGNWYLINLLIKNCLGNKSRRDRIFQPRPNFIKSFQNKKYLNIIDQYASFNYLITKIMILLKSELYIECENKKTIDCILDNFLHLSSFLLYNMITQLLNSFNKFIINVSDASTLIPSIKHSNIKIYELKHNDKKIDEEIKNNEEIKNKYAFHGSIISNWYSILLNGLIAPSESSRIKIDHGAAYGNGIYSSNDLKIPLGYCGSEKYNDGYRSDEANPDNEVIIGVIEVIGGIKQYDKGGKIFVIPDSKLVKLRYLIVGIQSIIHIYIKSLNNYFINGYLKNNMMDNSLEEKKVKVCKSKKSDNMISNYDNIVKLNSFIISKLSKVIRYSGIINKKFNNFIYIFKNKNDTNITTLFISIPTSNFKSSPLYHKVKHIENIEIRINNIASFYNSIPNITIIKPVFESGSHFILDSGLVILDCFKPDFWSKSKTDIYVIIYELIKNFNESIPSIKDFEKSYNYEKSQEEYTKLFSEYKFTK